MTATEFWASSDPVIAESLQEQENAFDLRHRGEDLEPDECGRTQLDSD